MLVVGDDAGVPRSKGGKVGRRGIAGTVLVQKIAGALAATGYVTEHLDVMTRADLGQQSTSEGRTPCRKAGRGQYRLHWIVPLACPCSWSQGY